MTLICPDCGNMDTTTKPDSSRPSQGSQSHASRVHPQYRTPATTKIARDVTKLIAQGMKQVDICKKLHISRGMCRYYAVGAGCYKAKEKRGEKICGNDLQKRNTPEDYKKYMTKNPYYFEDMAKGEPIDKLCAETMLLRRHMRRGDAEYFIDGLPEGNGDSTLFSIGYDGRGHDDG